MKRNILLASVCLIATSTLLGVSTAVLASSPETIARTSTVAGIFGLGSIGLFFVGLVFPEGK